MVVVKTQNLVKRYGDLLALDNVNFDIEEGQIVGLLGPNGAGKSTLISCITSISSYDSGSVEIFGKEMKQKAYDIKKDIGIVPQDLSFYPNMSAYGNVKFFSSLYGFKGKKLEEQVKKALEFVGLWEKRKQKPKKYSGGMKRRLNIACAIAHSPKLVIMDEPTVGIDPQSRNHILDSIRTLNRQGATIIYTSHYMEEVETLCSHINIMDNGRIIASGTKAQLKNMVSDESTLEIELENIAFNIIDKIKKIDGVVEAYIDNNRLLVVLRGKNIDEILLAINESKGSIVSVNMKKCTLEDVFFSLTGRTLRD
ncbi:MAG: ABC transporter ATP-binding protein [Clostridiales bacterium]|nr:ABC transporter ATP-binding protein [Clostridiales bacterium]